MTHPKTGPWEQGDWNTLYVTVHNRVPDALGRRGFTLQWMANNLGYHCNETGLRGQVFFAVLDTYLNKAKAEGKTIVNLSD
jgi:hypothetical protein